MSSTQVASQLTSGFFDKLTLGVVKSLEKREGVCDVVLKQAPGVRKSDLQLWEQKNMCILPEDLKCFYLTNNGFTLKWSVRMNDTRLPIGKMEVNSLENLIMFGSVTITVGNRPPSPVEVDSDDEDEKDLSRPKFDHRSRIFELDSCDGYGKLCLAYKNTVPGIPESRCEIWFMDRSLRWHFVADTFLRYYRLMLLHLGLPQWHYTFTPIGLSPFAMQWFNMYAPARLELFHHDGSPHIDDTSVRNEVDSSKVFKGRSDRRKITPAQNMNKRKPGAPPLKAPQPLKAVGTTSLVKPPMK